MSRPYDGMNGAPLWVWRMAWPDAFSAAQTLQHSGDGPDYGPTSNQNCEEGSDTALITKVMRALSSPPPLVLTQAMQRNAMILDRKKAAKMLDMQAVHRLEKNLRKLTNQILRGVCSDAKHG